MVLGSSLDADEVSKLTHLHHNLPIRLRLYTHLSMSMRIAFGTAPKRHKDCFWNGSETKRRDVSVVLKIVCYRAACSVVAAGRSLQRISRSSPLNRFAQLLFRH